MDISLDKVNAAFEFGGCLISIKNIIVLYKHKMIRGVSLLPSAYFFVWGLFNCLFFYNGLHQFWSWVCGIGITLVNLTWLLMASYYMRREVCHESDST